MKSPPILHPSDWDGIQLVVFDVDGTLYNQRFLRILMVRDMLFHIILKRDVRVYSVLTAYRRIREQWGDQENSFLEDALIAETAATVGAFPRDVQAIVAEWIEQRPIPYMGRCRYPGVADLFGGLRRNGTMIGILSDYPARAKLAALDLAADLMVSAGDEGVGFLKPHTRGLQLLIATAGAKTEATILIGDRVERDGLVAQRLGVRALIRSSKPIEGWQTFPHYEVPLFAPLLDRPPVQRS